MKVTLLRQQLNDSNRVSVFVDNEYSFSLTLDQLLEEKLKKDVEIDNRRLEKLKLLSDEGKLRSKALEWLMLRPHSIGEFRSYCYRKKIDKDFAERLVTDFTEKNFLDDVKFARWFSEQRLRKGKSTKAIRAELVSKGIHGDIAKTVVGESDSGSDERALIQLITKLRNRPRYQDDKRLTAYLLGKGFKYADIKSTLQSLNGSQL